MNQRRSEREMKVGHLPVESFERRKAFPMEDNSNAQQIDQAEIQQNQVLIQRVSHIHLTVPRAYIISRS